MAPIDAVVTVAFALGAWFCLHALDPGRTPATAIDATTLGARLIACSLLVHGATHPRSPGLERSCALRRPLRRRRVRSECGTRAESCEWPRLVYRAHVGAWPAWRYRSA